MRTCCPHRTRALCLRARAELLRGMWDLPGSEVEPVSPALAGEFFTAEPPGSPLKALLFMVLLPRI